MAVIVIGGHSRNVGKTSVVAGIVAALRDWNWTAVKVTQYGHGVCSNHGGPCTCAVDDPEHSFAINEEQDRSGDSDTSRFLVAGAQRSLWVRTRQGFLAEAMPELRRTLTGAENVIFESNSILKYIKPDLYVTVLDFATPDFKRSARDFLDRADAVIIHDTPEWSREIQPTWAGVSLRLVENRPVFRVRPPEYVTPEIVRFVEERLVVSRSSCFPH
jgi:molybdopterin-guanine dinucleotide biosynthesis protein